jgi:hemoglobin/transferrin/lactoferrin receptor protein
MKKLLLFLLGLVLWNVLFGQEVTVKDFDTGQPLELATLSSTEPEAFAATNAKGKADISAFRGSPAIEIRILGYLTETRSYAELEASGFVLELFRSNVSLDEVVVSATRWSQSWREIPAKVSSISPGEVALQNPQTAADLLGSGGEVFIQKSQQGGGSPMIRGFSANRLLLTIDGVRMNTAIFRSGNLQNVISLDPFAIERTEVFFGPGSVIYGSDAIGGVMSFQTLKPRLSNTQKTLVAGKAVTRFSSANDERTVHADIQAGWKKWALLTSITHTDYGDLRMGRHGPEEYLQPFYVQRIDTTDVAVANEDPQLQRPTGFEQTNLMQKVRFRPNEALDLEYALHYSTTSDYSRYDRLIRTRNGRPRSAEWQYGPQVWMMHNLNLSSRAESGLYDRLSLRLAHQFFEESRMDRDFNDSERRIRLEEVAAWSGNLDLIKSFGRGHQLFYGLEVVYNDVRSSGVNEDVVFGKETVGPSRYPQSAWSSYAAYLTWQYRLSPQFKVQAGSRYNYFLLDADFRNNLDFFPFPFETASLQNGALTGSVGVSWTPSDNWTIVANLATGFRSPNVDDVGKVFDSEPGSVVIPNPDLVPEYVYNAEAGFARSFGEALDLEITAYYSLLDNALVRRPFALNGQDSILYDGELSQVQAIQNAAQARVYGLQAEVDLRLSSGFGFTSRFSYQEGEEELDDGSTSPSRHAAPWFGITRLSYTTDVLRLEFNAQYCGKRPFEEMPQEEISKDWLYASDADGNPYSPGWYTLNFKALYQLSDHFSLSAGVENIADKRYRPYSSGLVAPGRNVVMAFRAEW